MVFDINEEKNNILNHLYKGTLSQYKCDKHTPENLIKLFNNVISYVTKGSTHDPETGEVKHKNYKMEFYFPLFELVVEEINKIYKLNNVVLTNQLDNFLQCILIVKINELIKGQIFLNKLNHRISKTYDKLKEYIIEYVFTCAKNGSFLSFMYWLGKTDEKKIESLSVADKEKIFVNSIGNSDDRIYKFVLEKILTEDKLFFQKSKTTIKDMILNLANSLVPPKYILKRIKLLSTYISLVPYFESMIEMFRDHKIILELHKHYYVLPHNFESLDKLVANLIIHDFNDDNGQAFVKTNMIEKLQDILKTQEEKTMVDIIMSTQHQFYSETSFNNFNKLTESVILSNYTSIFKHINANNFIESLDANPYNQKILNILTSNNLITKYIESNTSNKSTYWMAENLSLLFFTRFLSLSMPGKNSDHILHKWIKINRVLHTLRLFAKKRSKNKIIQYKVKMFDLLKEIKSFSPNKSVPVLKHGSNIFQQQKQKFTNLPPRHLLPGEISVYNNFLIREKADGILINNLPIGIYPQCDMLNNYQVKAEYIEDLDLYLIFDIDIPNTTIVERYNMLREAHKYTESTDLEEVSSMDTFINVFKSDRQIIKRFLKENNEHAIKWYPKFACKYSKRNDKFTHELIQNIILESDESISEVLKSSEPFNCDGVIISPLNGDREIKIKPKSMMTIDLMFDGKKYVDRQNIDWSNYIIKSKTAKKEGRIYRCYPDLTTLPELKFTVGEFRYDKKNPNPNNIVDSIINMVKHNWEQDLSTPVEYYYGEKKKIQSKSLIDTIKMQNDLLEQKISLLEPSVNKNWLDLGCGKGKLIQYIRHYNPKRYLGLDIDTKQLVQALKYHDENQNVYNFSPCNLAGDWTQTDYIWQSINKNIKYDYVVANFALMHFFTDEFWNQLNDIVHDETKFLFNVVNVRNENKWSDSESFLEVTDGITKYKFEWTHWEVKSEPYISQDQIQETIKKHGWKILNTQDMNSKYPLINMYRWMVLQKM